MQAKTPLPLTSIFPGRYVQGPGVLSLLPGLSSALGRNALVIAGGTAMREIVPGLAGAFSEAGAGLLAEPFGGECTDAEIERVCKTAKSGGCDMIIAMGGGKTLDTGKAAAHAAGVRSVIVPTIASTDAPCSAVSVIYDECGAFKRYIFLPRNPDLVVVDTRVIARAPVRFLVAGIGDALSTWFEADSCRRACAPNQAGGVGTLAAFTLARLCYDTILEFGLAACISCRHGAVSPALEHVVEANTLLSGLGFESAGLASAHSIHNGLTTLPEAHDYYHGEKVAFGVLAGLFLADRPRALIDEVYGFCESVGLPVTLPQIGVIDPADADLWKVARASCAEGETIFHEPSPATPERVFEAIRMADAYGRERGGNAEMRSETRK